MITKDELRTRLVAAGYHVTLADTVDANTAAVALELSPRTLLAMRQEGTGPEYLRLNGRIWYELDALVAYWNSAERTHTDARRRRRARGQP